MTHTEATAAATPTTDSSLLPVVPVASEGGTFASHQEAKEVMGLNPSRGFVGFACSLCVSGSGDSGSPWKHVGTFPYMQTQYAYYKRSDSVLSI